MDFPSDVPKTTIIAMKWIQNEKLKLKTKDSTNKQTNYEEIMAKQREKNNIKMNTKRRFTVTIVNFNKL